MLTVSSTILQVNHLQQLSGNSHLRTILCSLIGQYLWILVFALSVFLTTCFNWVKFRQFISHDAKLILNEN